MVWTEVTSICLTYDALLQQWLTRLEAWTKHPMLLESPCKYKLSKTSHVSVTFQKFWKMKIIYSFLSALLVVKIWMSSIWSGPGPASEKRRKWLTVSLKQKIWQMTKKILNKPEGGRELEIYIYFFLILK